uniref:Uncharacterized protein n=1 Tax=Populus trichocarpa x Populus deltoides TaxID=3695 RepID=A9PK23_9ROSI|nr:unknown [Populus trichocarpa x Populus deltoides]
MFYRDPNKVTHRVLGSLCLTQRVRHGRDSTPCPIIRSSCPCFANWQAVKGSSWSWVGGTR